jgi:hypothetical protein
LKRKRSKKQHDSGSNQNLLNAGFLIGLLFNPEDGGSMILRNVDWHLSDNT